MTKETALPFSCAHWTYYCDIVWWSNVSKDNDTWATLSNVARQQCCCQRATMSDTWPATDLTLTHHVSSAGDKKGSVFTPRDYMKQIVLLKCKITMVVNEKYLSAILLNLNFSSIFLTACFVCRNKTINNILPRVLFGGLTAHIVLFEQARNVSTVEFSFFFCAFPRTTQPVQNTQLRYPLPLLFTDVRLCTVAAASRCHTRVDVTRWFCREATYSLASLLPTTPQDSIQSKSHNLTQWLS